MRISLSTRQLLVSTCYAGSAACFMAYMATNASAFSTFDMAITIAGVAPWGLAAIHGLSRRCLAKKAEWSPVVAPDDQPPAIAESTHAKINSSLHVISSSCFIASDLYYIASATPVIATRVSGSFLWLKSAAISLWLAYHQEQETETTRLCGLNKPTLTMMADAEFLAAGFLYLYAIWSDTPLMPFKAAGNFCWILGCTHEVIRSFLAWQEHRQHIAETGHLPDYTSSLTAIQIEPATQPSDEKPSPLLASR